MADQTRIELNHAGVAAAALTSPEVRGELRRIGEATAARARALTNLPIEVDEAGKDRARVYVSMPYGAREEAKNRILGRSLPSGGG